MPIYEYVCNQCQHELETIQGFRERPLTDCPQCGERSLQKKVSAAAFHLKGTGWYETDFKDKPKKSEKQSKQDSVDKGDTKSKAKSDSKNGSTGRVQSKKSSSSSQSPKPSKV